MLQADNHARTSSLTFCRLDALPDPDTNQQRQVQTDCIDLAQRIIVIINHLIIPKQARNRQQLRLLVIIVVTKYCTLTARFLNARLLK